MKIIQSNIWGGKLTFQILDYFAEQDFDIACLQEVNDLSGPSGTLFATLEEIADSGKFDHKDMLALWSSGYMNRSLDYGNAILSKLPIVERNSIFIYGQYKSKFDVIDSDPNTRAFQHVVLQTAGKQLHVLNHHGYYVAGTKAGNQETLRQNKLIAEYIKPLEGPVILCGDFNLEPNSESMRVFSDTLVDLSSKYGLTSTYSDLSFHNSVCDYIFVSSDVKVNNFKMIDSLLSDHKALVLDFDI